MPSFFGPFRLERGKTFYVIPSQDGIQEKYRNTLDTGFETVHNALFMSHVHSESFVSLKDELRRESYHFGMLKEKDSSAGAQNDVTSKSLRRYDHIE